MPPSKVCPQCQAVVPPRLKVCKSCEHVCPAKRKVEQNLPEQANLLKTTKRATETSEQTVHRREQHKGSIRASETSRQTIVTYCTEGFALQCSS